MILEHPEHRKTKRVNRTHYFTIKTLKEAGWKERTYERTPKQIEATRKWMNHGQLARTQANIKEVFRREREHLTDEQRKALNKAEIVIQQLIKKYQPT